jgi:hypothetical protein
MGNGSIEVLDRNTGENPMCTGEERNCPEFELHRQKLLEDLDAERRSFLKGAFAATGGTAASIDRIASAVPRCRGQDNGSSTIGHRARCSAGFRSGF